MIRTKNFAAFKMYNFVFWKQFFLQPDIFREEFYENRFGIVAEGSSYNKLWLP
jgi:hypothetical protein